jgi:hypothetical protein
MVIEYTFAPHWKYVPLGTDIFTPSSELTPLPKEAFLFKGMHKTENDCLLQSRSRRDLSEGEIFTLIGERLQQRTRRGMSPLWRSHANPGEAFGLSTRQAVRIHRYVLTTRYHNSTLGRVDARLRITVRSLPDLCRRLCSHSLCRVSSTVPAESLPINANDYRRVIWPDGILQ